MSPVELVLAWLGLVNLIAFGMYGLDKRAASRGARRVPEARLLWPALFGGAPGSWLAMRVFRHKTRKLSFRWRFWALTALNLAACGALYWWSLRGESGLD